MQNNYIEKLKAEIQNLYDTTKGYFAIAFQDLTNRNNKLFINEKENFHAASTMKTPVMIEVYKQADEGKFSLSDLILIKNEFKSIVDNSSYSMDINEDSGENLYHFIGQKKSIKELVFDMITVSSNLATNILIQLVGAENIMKTIRKLGANDIRILRGVEDIKAYNIGLNNTTTANDLKIIYEKLAEGDVVSKDASSQMVEVLLEQKHNAIIPAELPDIIKAAHKTGSITGVVHDSGIVFLPDGRKYILILLSKNLISNNYGVNIEAKFSKFIYDFMMKEY